MMVSARIFSCTCTDTWIFSCTCTDSWCYVTRPSSLHAQTVDATSKEVKRSPTSDAWCYVTRSCLVIGAQTFHVALQGILFYMRKHLMVSERIFSCTCTDTWCYINRPFLVSCTDTWGYKIFSCTCTLARTLGATLKDLPSYLHRHWCYVTGCWATGGGPYHGGGWGGYRAAYIYIILYIYLSILYYIYYILYILYIYIDIYYIIYYIYYILYIYYIYISIYIILYYIYSFFETVTCFPQTL